MIITEVKSKQLDKYNADLLILPTIFSTVKNITFTLDEIKKLNRNDICLKVDKIITEEEVESLDEFIQETSKLNIKYYVYTDLAVLYLLKKYKLDDKCMYFSKTINCSKTDISEYNKMGIKCLVSTELTLDEIKEISDLENNIIYTYGYSNIFYSKRKLVSLYKDYANLDYECKDKLYTLKEETREERYPILENNNGTFIYTPYIYTLFHEIDKINKNNYFYIDSTFIEEEDLLEVLNIYNEGMNKGFSTDLINKLLKVNRNIGKGFLYLKPSILKEDN